MRPIALISVHNKNGIVQFAKKLQKSHHLVSTGGTWKVLVEGGVSCQKIEELTNFPEILEGRVKTLHPLIFGGILANRKKEDHLTTLETLQIAPIDVVVCNFYPFEEKTKEQNLSSEELLEWIDIGGPTLVRAAAKNYMEVLIITDPADYDWVGKYFDEAKPIPMEARQYLATKAFEMVMRYDIAIYRYFQSQQGWIPFHQEETSPWGTTFVLHGVPVRKLRYGENPHQRAWYHLVENEEKPFFRQLHGKPVSYNNLLDCLTALRILRYFDQPAAAIIKHTSPCGVAAAPTLEQAFLDAFNTDKLSAYGSFMGFNKVIDYTTAIHLHNMFVDGIIAPGYADEAFEILSRKQRIMLLELDPDFTFPTFDITMLPNGFMVQDFDDYVLTEKDLTVVSEIQPTKKDIEDLLFAWKVVQNLKSNAAVVTIDTKTLGCASGKTSRIDAVKYACDKAGDRAKGAVLASDAFFPFRDSIDHAASVGIRAVLAPGGSIRDPESINAANEHGIPLLFSKYRAFRH